MTATSPLAARRGEVARRQGLLTAADLTGAVRYALLTAGVIGAVCLLYSLGWGLGLLTYHFGLGLFLAANGAL